MKNKAVWIAGGVVLLAAGLGVLVHNIHGSKPEETVPNEDLKNTSQKEQMLYEAKHTPYGRYPEEVTYTLGKISGSNNANLPAGDTYEDNGYTRYLKKMLNIQNNDVFEMEDGDQYYDTVQLAIQDRDIPDVMVVKGWNNLNELVKTGQVEDLTQVYQECTTDRIKEMYNSYGTNLLESAIFDGKLYALPDTVIDHGATLLWMRKDWIDRLGLEEPKTMEEAVEIIRAFVSRDMAGNGETIGLACSTSLVSENSSTYPLDPVFTMFQASPQNWILDEAGDITYGALTQETKRSLEYLSELYRTRVLDQRFLLRTTDNIDDLIMQGKCGAFFGKWWAPNNPLMAAYSADSGADWQPYFLTAGEENQVRTFESYSDWLYVVVRKGYEHPEIAPKYVNIMFDYSRYEDKNAEEINNYFSLNVDPTARPMNINVDYRDTLYRVTKSLRAALDGQLLPGELNGLEKSYYNTCKSFMNGNLTTANAWAAYASRITAVGVLVDSGIQTDIPLSLGESDGEIPSDLQKLEKQTFLQIISGEKPAAYFDTFVEQWYVKGGGKLTQQVRQEQKNE